jgi:S-DNA-T family DNA segregation ATPase FtsK/SpoIIIE
MPDPQRFSRNDLHTTVVPIRPNMSKTLLDDEPLELAEADESEQAPGVGVQLYEEVVEGTVVDDPATVATAGGWMADRRTYLDAAPAVIAPYLRNLADLKASTRFVLRYYCHKAAFHTVRTPLYWGRLAAQSPRGVTRLTRRWARWVTDAEARPVVAQVAGGKDGDAWIRVATTQTQRTAKRRRQTLVAGIPAALLITLAAVFLPGWQLALVGAAVTSLLGLAGGNPDRPVVKRYVSVHLQRRLESPEVEAAIAAIGIKGKVDFVNPIATDGPGWRAELDLPGATTADRVLEKRNELAAAMRRPVATVWPDGDRNAHPGRLVLWVAREDPAKAKRRLWPLMHDGQADVFKPLPVGFDPRGNLVSLLLMYSNLLVGGIPGSGKTSWALAIVLGVALDPTAALWVYELKGSGDLDSVKPVCHKYVSGDDDEDLDAGIKGLRAGIAEQKRRAKFIKSLPAEEVPDGRRTTRELAARYPEQDLGPRVIVIDEVQELFTSEEHKDEAAYLCTRLIKKGRAYGIILILLTQNPDAPSLPSSVSSSVGTRLCLAVMDWRANNNVLGTGAHERGLRATEISVTEQGTGILAQGRDGSTVRAAFIKQTEAEQIGQRALALRIAAGTLSGEAIGETVVEVEDVDLLADIRAVWPAGQESIHSYRLVEALAAAWPSRYGHWVATEKPLGAMTPDEVREAQSARSTALSVALKPLGVRTVQVNRRGDGGSAKGLQWSDLPAAYVPDEDEDGDD